MCGAIRAFGHNDDEWLHFVHLNRPIRRFPRAIRFVYDCVIVVVSIAARLTPSKNNNNKEFDSIVV